MDFGKKAVIALTCVSERQLEYWATSVVVRPSLPASRRGTRRRYSFKDLVALRVAKGLKDEGLSLQKIRKALAWLRKNFPDLNQPLTEMRFLSNGRDLFILTADPVVMLNALTKQFMFSLALGELIADLQGQVKRLATPKEEKMMVEGRTYTVLLTSDLEDSGYTAQYREESAAISHGATEQ